MTNKKEKINICIYEFMRGLGLKNSALSIYAFLYAYRKSEAGFYYGRRQFIADECGVSLRTVERVISKLIERGLIENVIAGKYHGYACSEEFLPESALEYEPTSFEECPAPPDFGSAFFRTDIKPKYEMVGLGRYVIMTREQCEALLALVPIQMLESYAARMDRMLENNMASGISPPKSYYKTIKKWILEDCSL